MPSWASVRHCDRPTERHADEPERRHVQQHRHHRQRRRGVECVAGGVHDHRQRGRERSADDLRHAGDQRQCGHRVQLPAERRGSGRRHADVQHPEPADLGDVQHQHRPAVRHADGGAGGRVLEHRDLGERRHGDRRRCRRSRSRSAQPTNGSATLSWTPPTQNTDGSTLTNLAGFRIHVRHVGERRSTQTVEIANPGVATYVVTGLNSGTWYFAVKAYNSGGAESANVERRQQDDSVGSGTSRIARPASAGLSSAQTPRCRRSAPVSSAPLVRRVSSAAPSAALDPSMNRAVCVGACVSARGCACASAAEQKSRRQPARSASSSPTSRSKNGLRVQLVEDHGAPVIALNVAYDVGSRNERNGAHRLRAPVRAHDVQGLEERRRRRALLPGVLQRRLDERHHQQPT